MRRIKKMNPSVGGFSGLFPFGALFCPSYSRACISLHAEADTTRSWSVAACNLTTWCIIHEPCMRGQAAGP